jgi:(4S)-4-hydroxy-5-phosphonooxypentane-2,3-dione isomerase
MVKTTKTGNISAWYAKNMVWKRFRSGYRIISVTPFLQGVWMHIVLVHVHVKPEFIEDFRRATLENARNSVLEPGVARFDILQSAADPAYFVLVEAYRTPEDPSRHKETSHYLKWRDTVADMMAEPRNGVKFANLFPDDTGWG